MTAFRFFFAEKVITHSLSRLFESNIPHTNLPLAEVRHHLTFIDLPAIPMQRDLSLTFA